MLATDVKSCEIIRVKYLDAIRILTLNFSLLLEYILISWLSES
jgi:hypothetical protein